MHNDSDKSCDFDMEKWIELAESVMEERSTWSYTLYVVSMYMLFVVGLIGNLLTCIVIYCDKSMHTTTNCYLFNLAVSDLLAIFGILLDVNDQLDKPGQWIHPDFGRLACKIQFFTVLTLWNNSVLIMTALAVERYIAICYPMTLKSKPWRRVKWTIVSIWVVAILEALSEVFTIDLTRTKTFSFCFMVPKQYARIVSGVSAIITFLVPLSIMSFVYIMIAFEINVTLNYKPRDKTFNRRDHRCKVNKLIVALSLSFLICWLPYFMVRMVVFTVDIPQLLAYKKIWSIGYYVTAFNGWFSSVLNPLLFSLISTKFRKSLKALWRKKIRGQRSEFRKITTTV